jgi:uncharacterized protein YbjT (DUF2867 family)
VAGDFERRYQIEHRMHSELARAAKPAGYIVFKLISSSHGKSQSWIPYARIKGEIKADIKVLNFERNIILRHGIIIGNRQEG